MLSHLEELEADKDQMQLRRPLSALAPHKIFCMAMASDSNKRGLSRFSNQKDPVYLKLVSQMHRLVLFHASAIEQLENFLTSIWTLPTVPSVQADVEDERGRSALHCAASSLNKEAVTILYKKGTANVLHKDVEGQTPLHAVIRKAARVKPTGDDQQKFKNVIILLMYYSEDISQVDDERKTAWAYGEDLPWIEEIKNNRDLFLGPSTSDEIESLELLKVPDKGTPQYKACEALRGDLVEFYTTTKDQKTVEMRNPEKPAVLEMIYTQGPKKILDRSRPTPKEGEALTCRWMHVPANNVGSNFTPSLDFF